MLNPEQLCFKALLNEGMWCRDDGSTAEQGKLHLPFEKEYPGLAVAYCPGHGLWLWRLWGSRPGLRAVRRQHHGKRHLPAETLTHGVTPC